MTAQAGRTLSGSAMAARGARSVVAAALLVLLEYGASSAHGVTILVTREKNSPESVEIAVGDEVHWTNASGGIAHVWFRGDDAIKFYLGTSASHVKFEKPGTYTYTGHMGAGTKPHAHTGTIIVEPR